MFDTRARQLLAGPLDRLAAVLDRPWVTPDRVTVLGLLVGVGAAAAAARSSWWVALTLWLSSRLLDGVDGALARRRRRAGGTCDDSDAGGYLDITSDFIVYGAFVVGVALGAGQSMVPFLLVLLAYYVNGSAFLAFSSLAERRGVRIDDGRSLSFIGGLAEGTETVVVHSLWCVLPQYAAQIAWVWAAVVGLSAAHRILAGRSILRRPVPDATDSRATDPIPATPAAPATASGSVNVSESGLAWSSPAQATWLILRGATFPAASKIALVVGTGLTVVNQASTLASGTLGTATLLRIMANYLIPYVVSSVGILAAHRVPGWENDHPRA